MSAASASYRLYYRPDQTFSNQCYQYVLDRQLNNVSLIDTSQLKPEEKAGIKTVPTLLTATGAIVGKEVMGYLEEMNRQKPPLAPARPPPSTTAVITPTSDATSSTGQTVPTNTMLPSSTPASFASGGAAFRPNVAPGGNNINRVELTALQNTVNTLVTEVQRLQQWVLPLYQYQMAMIRRQQQLAPQAAPIAEEEEQEPCETEEEECSTGT